MQLIHNLLAASRLDDAISALQEQLRESPANTDLRALLIELLCINNDLERADEQLGFLMKHHPELGVGTINLRQLIRAQQARRAFHQGLACNDIVIECTPVTDQAASSNGADRSAAAKALLAIQYHIANADNDAATSAALELEEHRAPSWFWLDTADTDPVPVRDCDDSLNSYLEGLGTDGKYYLWSWQRIDSVDIAPPATLLERVWRRASVVLDDGRQGEVFLPMSYVNSHSAHQRLGRESDWHARTPRFVTGQGQKMLLAGEDAIALNQIKRLVRVQQPLTQVHG